MIVPTWIYISRTCRCVLLLQLDRGSGVERDNCMLLLAGQKGGKAKRRKESVWMRGSCKCIVSVCGSLRSISDPCSAVRLNCVLLMLGLLSSRMKQVEVYFHKGLAMLTSLSRRGRGSGRLCSSTLLISLGFIIFCALLRVCLIFQGNVRDLKLLFLFVCFVFSHASRHF